RMLKLEVNYGSAGAIYADFLARNMDTVTEVIDNASKHFNKTCNFIAKERFWQNVIITIVSGAHLANLSGLTKFDVAAIAEMLVDTLKDLRINILDQTYTLTGPGAGDDVLTEMMADIRGRHMVLTETCVIAQKGKPSGAVMVPDGSDPMRLQNVWMQTGDQDGNILVRIRPFNQWLIEHGYQPEHILKLLERDYRITKGIKATVGAGIAILKSVDRRASCYFMVPKVAPSHHNTSSPSSIFGSTGPT